MSPVKKMEEDVQAVKKMEEDIQAIMDNLVHKVCKRARKVTFLQNVKYVVIPNKENIAATCNMNDLWWKPYHYALSGNRVYNEYIQFMKETGLADRSVDPKICKAVFWHCYSRDC